uniref:Uncharacterized protein n=1 Tax=Aegilops tauschii TaxID=37682 RepID=R7VZ30_AEGTA
MSTEAERTAAEKVKADKKAAEDATAATVVPASAWPTKGDYPGISYTPAMEAPDRVPAGRFSLNLNDRYSILSCRHSLVLISHSLRNQVLVWDPVTGDQHCVAAPLGIDMATTLMDGQVLRAAADAQHFQVVLVNYKKKYARAIAAIYSSETEGGGLRVLSLTGFAAELCKRNTDCDGVASWVLDELLNWISYFP